MLELAAEAGFSPLELWDMTHREIQAIVLGHARSLRLQHRLALISGWHAGAISRAKKPPPLAKLLKPFEEPKPPMSPRQLRAAIIAANRAMGGKVTYRPKALPRSE